MQELGIFFGGLLLGILVTASLGFPAVGRTIAKILAVLLLGTGIGFLTWASFSLYRHEPLRPPFGSNVITEVGEAFGWGAGLLVGGIVALALACWRRSVTKDVPVRSQTVTGAVPSRAG